MNPLKLWRAWRLYEEVKDMDSKALLKIAVCAFLAASGLAGTEFLSGSPVDFAACVSAAVMAVVAYLQKQPHA